MVARNRQKDCARQITNGVDSDDTAVGPGGIIHFFKEDDYMARKEGSLGGEMRIRVNNHCTNKGNKTRRNYKRACEKFDSWRKETGISNCEVRNDRRGAVERWRDALLETYAVSTVHTYIAGVCCGLGIPMDDIARHGTAEDKTKSLGNSPRAQAARKKESNSKIVGFQEAVGGRRSALGDLTGADLVTDESGALCVRFAKDKGGKDQLQRIAPEDVETVKACFEGVGQDELLFPYIDRDLDLHGIRAEHARKAYGRYLEICATPEGREEMRRQLWERYKDPEVGCKAYKYAKEAGNKVRMERLEYLFEQELAEGTYYLRSANRRVAIARGLPTAYDRLALCCVSVFCLSHWRNEVTVKHYML